MTKKFMIVVAIITFISASLISLNHIFCFIDNVSIPTRHIGLLGWLTMSLVVVSMSYSFFRQAILVWCLFFCVGFFFGPFLEPPSDSLVHLARIQRTQQLSSSEIPHVNNGLWHYSMLSLFVVQDDTLEKDAEVYINHIEIAHAVVVAYMLCIIFIGARRVGLKSRWALFSCLIAWLFMGTNRFSFFSYYTFAPSASSLMIYWLWIACFFMKGCWKNHLKGIICALLALPILLTNHIQEAVFLIFLLSVWIVLNVLLHLYKRPNSQEKIINTAPLHLFKKRFSLIKASLVFLLIFLLYILPQFDYFIDWASSFYMRKNYHTNQEIMVSWKQNSELVINWFGLYLGGKIWAYRVNDTLGGIGILIGALSFIYFWPGLIRKSFHDKIKIFILSAFPFLIYFTPLFHFFWVANVESIEYYRLCYSASFWLFFSYLLQNSENRLFIIAKTKFIKQTRPQ